ncbi:MAG: O-antigen ligase family protein [Thiotrichaceae bacterium]
MGRIWVSKDSLVLFTLSLFFAAYAAVSFTLTINYFNDYQTLIVVSVLSPLYVLLATLVADRKKQILVFVYLISSVYLVFIIFKWLNGDLEPGKDTIFIQVFDTVGSEFYQNINKYLGLVCILTMGIFTQRSWLMNFLKIALVMLCVFFMLKIGGRAAIVSLTMVFFFWYFLLRIRLGSMYFILSMVVLVIVSYMLLLSLDTLIVLMQESNITSINRFANLFIGSDSSHREFLFTKALEQFTDSPKNLFFGGGMNSFSIFSKENNINLYPHNIILELLAEYGIVGFLLFMLPIFYLFTLRRNRLGSYIGTDRIDRIFFMLFLYFFLIHMFTGSLRGIWFFTFITFLLYPSPRKLYLKIT